MWLRGFRRARALGRLEFEVDVSGQLLSLVRGYGELPDEAWRWDIARISS